MDEIEIFDADTGETRRTPTAGTAAGLREVRFYQGEMVDEDEEADEVVPIVRVVIFPRNQAGELVAREQASLIAIRDYGPEDRLLRETLVIPDR